MKQALHITATIISALFFVATGRAQSPSSAAGNSHPTVSNVTVSYKTVSQNTFPSASGIMAIPQATINLKSNAQKIYFKMLKGNDTLYQVSYFLDSPAVYNAQGFKLFQRTDDKVFISMGESLPVKPYRVIVQTEDSLSNRSTVFSVIR